MRDEPGRIEREKFFTVYDNSKLSPVIIHLPHGAVWIPEQYVADFVLDETSLTAEARLMADQFTIETAKQTYETLDRTPSMFINQVSRLVFDAERFDDDSEEMNAVGMGVLYTKTSSQAELRKLSPDRATQIKKELYLPYSEALGLLVNRVLKTQRQVTIIDFHSYSKEPLPYELHKDQSRPEICIGVDKFHTPDWLVELVNEMFQGFDSIEINQPFSGSYVPLEHYRTNPLVKSFMLEIRKDVFETKAGILKESLLNLLAHLN